MLATRCNRDRLLHWVAPEPFEFRSSMKLLSASLGNRLAWCCCSPARLVGVRENALAAFGSPLQPLAFIVLFSTVFSHFMRARFGSVSDLNAYTIYLISWVPTWNAFANGITRLGVGFRAPRPI